MQLEAPEGVDDGKSLDSKDGGFSTKKVICLTIYLLQRDKPPVELLAFRLQPPEEVDLPEIWPEPMAMVVQVLSTYATVEEA